MSSTEEEAEEVGTGAIDPVALSKDAASVFGERLGVTLDYSPKSLKRLDRAISRYFRKEEPLPTTVLSLGAYLGEVIRRNIGGRWKLKDNYMECYIGDLGVIEALYPFRRVYKRFVRGKRASLHLWFVAAARIASLRTV
jgi:hypothetical protein